MAVAHRLLLIADQVSARREPYRERGADYLERRHAPATVDRLARLLQQLGVVVTTTDVGSAVPPVGAAFATSP